jgi:hypothetical protein
MTINRLYYVLYDDDWGNEASTLVYAPSRHVAEALMRPRPVVDVIEITDAVFELELIAESDHFNWEVEN